MKEIALHIMDVAENGVRAGAKRIEIAIRQEMENELLHITVEDDGHGMEKSELERTKDPFYTSRTTRNVGLGIPLFRQQAEMTGGKLEINSEPGKGTQLKADLHPGHPDCQPLGDLEGCWVLLVTSYPGIEWILNLSSEAGEFSISTTEIKSALEVKSISGIELSEHLKRLIRNNIDELGLYQELGGIHLFKS